MSSMRRFVIDVMAASHKGLGIVGRKIITEEFPNRKEAMRYLCKNYYNIKINKITEMKKFAVKFFGNKERKEQIKKVKMTVEAESRADVETVLREKYRYLVINSLKIHESDESSE